MTDNELKELVASLAISQKKTDKQLAETDKQLAESARQQTETKKQQAEAQKQQAKTEKQLAKTDARLNKIAEMYGGVSNNQGDVAEEFFYNSLKETMFLKGIHFDFIEKNRHRALRDLEDEYDILLINGSDIFIIEVKYKAHLSDLDKLTEKKALTFKKLFPAYQNYKHHLGLASFHLNEDLKKEALHRGVTILQRKGDLIETTGPA